MSLPDKLIDNVSRAVTASDPVPYLKGCMAIIWRALPASERRAFYGAIDTGTDDLSLIGWKPKWPDLNDLQLEQAARVWPAILATVRTPDIEFASDVNKRLRWPHWTPTEKQRAWMKRLHNEWRAKRA